MEMRLIFLVFQFFLVGEKHKCQNKNCSAEKLSAPLYVFIQMQLCKTESLKDWLKANFERNHVFCIRVFEQVSGYCHFDFSHLKFSIETLSKRNPISHYSVMLE